MHSFRRLQKLSVDEIQLRLYDHATWLEDRKTRVLTRRSWVGLDLKQADLQGADLRGADFSRSDLSGADLQGVWLSEADCDNAIFCGANLQGALFDGADFSGADLRGAKLDASIQSAWSLNGSLWLYSDVPWWMGHRSRGRVILYKENC